MKTTLSWLREFVTLPDGLTAGQLDTALVELGMEVESIVDQGATVTGDLVVGRVLEVEELTGFKKPIRFNLVDVGRDNTKLKVGDRVVIPFTISCGQCFFCKRGFYSGCERSNPNREKAAKLWGNSPAGLFGYSHLLGGFAGGQAEYIRVPYADVGPIKVPTGLTDEHED